MKAKKLSAVERLAYVALVIGTACSGCSSRPALSLPDRPSDAVAILPVGILELSPGAVIALVTPEADTVFAQAIDSSAVAFWNGRKLAGVVRALPPDAPIPPPDAEPVLRLLGGDVRIVFVAYDNGVLGAGVVYRPLKRA